MHIETNANLDAAGLRIGIVRSRYHADITDALCAGAVDVFTRAGGSPEALTIVESPGAFELTALSKALADRSDVDAVVAIGCIVRGETSHDQSIADALVQGLTSITLSTGKPVAFGVLTCQTMHQARERAGGEKGNKGAEAMAAAIEATRSLRTIEAGAAGAMSANARDFRRCALQALYQLDALQAAAVKAGVKEDVADAAETRETIRHSLAGSDGGDRAHQEGFALALAAWLARADADAALGELSPDWPTYRQPVIDRSILRLAHHELVSASAPPKVVINEAVELAKEFSTERSPMFVNGVLDKFFRVLRGAAADKTEPEPAAEPIAPPVHDAPGQEA